MAPQSTDEDLLIQLKAPEKCNYFVIKKMDG